MTRPHVCPTALRLEQLEDRQNPSGTTIPAGEFNWMQYSPTGELAQLVWEGQTLVYRNRAANAWHEEAIATAPDFTQAQYDSRDQVQKASQSAQLVFTADGTPHVLFLESQWVGAANGYQTVVEHYARVGNQWQKVESIAAPWLSTWGPSNLVAEAGPNNSLHILFAETYNPATGVGNTGTGILWYGTNKSGAWQFDKVADTADLKQDVWFSGGRWAPRFLSMAVDGAGNAHVTYTPQFYIAGAFSTVYSELKYATNASGSWQSETVLAPGDGTADAGLGASVAVSASGQVAVASYYVDRYSTGSPQASKLVYSTRNGDGTWTHTDVATSPDGYVAGDGAKFTGFAPQLYFNAAGQPVVTFSDEAGEHLPVTYANEFAGQIRVATLAGGKWSLQTVYRQTDPIHNQLFYPVAAEFNGQVTYAGLQVTSATDGNKNLTSSDFAVVDVNAPAGPATPITAASPASNAAAGGADAPPGTVVVGGPQGGGVGSANPSPGASSTPAPFAAGTDATPGVSSSVAVYNADGQLDFTITPFGADYTGGARVTRADVTGDGVPDVIVGSGGGIQARVRIWDGQTHALVFDQAPFEDFTGGVVVAAGDINGDGIADVVIGPDQGGGPRVQLWAGGSFRKLVPDFFGLPYPDFRGGLRLAVGDIDRDGYADLVVAPGYGGGPRVTVLNGRSLAQGSPTTMVNDFFVFDDSLRTGAYLAVGDVDGDGYADIVAGAGAGGGPRVRVVSGADLAAGRGPTVTADFYAAGVDERDGARVGNTQTKDGKTAVLTGTAGTRLSVFTGAAIAARPGEPDAGLSFPVFAGVPGGVFVG